TNPRSLAFQLAALSDEVDDLPRDFARPGRSTEQRLVLAALTAVRLADIDQLARGDARAVRPELDALLVWLTADLPQRSDTIVRDMLRGDHTEDGLESYQFAFDSAFVKAGPDLAAYAAASFPAGRPILEGVLDLTKRIHADFRYDPSATTVTTPLHRILSTRRGVCQDFAHLQIGCLRSLGLAARYVSGYLLTIPPPGQPRLVGADASHAWASFFCPGSGWI